MRKTFVLVSIVVSALLLGTSVWLKVLLPQALAAQAGQTMPNPILVAPTPGCGWQLATSIDRGSTSELVSVSALTANDVWAVGGSGGSPGITLVEHWDGSQWTIVPSRNPGSSNNVLSSVFARATADVWAVGYYANTNSPDAPLIEHWDGTGWSVVPSPAVGSSSYLRRVVALAANDIWAVGHYCCIATSTQTLIEHWDGSNWNIVPSANLGTANSLLEGLAAVAANDIWAVGIAGPPNQTLTEHWDGTSWSVVPSPNPNGSNNQLFAVSALASADIWAVGDYDAGGFSGTLMIHWDGSQWSVVSSPNFGTDTHQLYGVAALNAQDVWAVGYHCCSNDTDWTLTEHWDGSAWSIVPSPNPGRMENVLDEVAMIAPADVWAVGDYIDSQGFERTLAAHNGGPCPALSPTATAPAPSPSKTPSVPPTATATPMSSPVTATPTPCAPDAIQNGGFETGIFSPWVIRDGNPPPLIRTTQPHSGTYSACLGSCLGPAGGGNSSIYQQVSVPAMGGTLSFWFYPYSQESILYDWQDAYVTDTSGNVLATIMHICSNTQTWTNVTFNMAPYAGQTVRIEFLVHQDGNADFTSMYVDDVALPNVCSTATATGTPTPSATATSPPLPTATHLPMPTGTATRTPSDTVTSTPAAAETATPTPTAPAPVCTLTFTDVPPAQPFYLFVRCLACRGILSGYADGTYRPGAAVTRGQAAKIVANAAGLTAPIPADRQSFADVPPAQPFWLWVERLAAAPGYIINGYACGGPGEPCDSTRRPYFRPGAAVTRGEVAKIVANAAGYQEAANGQTFEDVPASQPFYVWIERLAARAIIAGYECGVAPAGPCVPPRARPYFVPGSPVTRGQMAKIATNTFFPGCAALARP